MSIETTATGGGYYIVYADGVKIGQHSTEREALAQAVNYEQAHPEAKTEYKQEYVVSVESDAESPEQPPENTPVELKSVKVNGPTETEVGEQVQYTLTGTYSDGSTKDLTTDSDTHWINSGGLHWEGNGKFTASARNPDATVMGKYGNIYDVLHVNVEAGAPPQPEPVALHIVGPATLAVGSRGHYSALIEYDDETTASAPNATWKFDTTLLQSVDGTQQDFKALAAGVATIHCTSGEFETELKVTLEAVDKPPVEPPTDGGSDTDEKVTVELLADDDGHSVFKVAVGYGMHPFKVGNAHGCIFHSKDGSVNVYNAYFDTTASITGTLILTAPDGTELAHELLKPAIGIGMGTIPRWYKKPVAKKPDAAMLALLPNYMPGTPNSWAGYANKRDYSLTGLGISSTGFMSATGERVDLGNLPGWLVPAILNPTDENIDVVRKSGDSAAVFSVHCFDPETNLPVSIEKWRGVSWNWYYTGHDRGGIPNPIKHGGTGPYEAGYIAHLTGFSILETMMFDTEYDKLELASWANYGEIISNPGYRNYEKGDGIMTIGQVRGRAWGSRQIFAAAVLLGEDYMDGYFHRLCTNILARAKEHYLNMPGMVDPHTHYDDSTAFAPWQLHYCLQAFGWIKRMVKGTAWEADMQAIIEKLGRPVVDSMGVGSDVICYQRASSYTVKCRASKDAPVATTYEEAYKLNNYDDSKGCGNLFASRKGYDHPDSMSGYPWGNTGYPAIMKGALAACVDAGIEGAQAAWDLYCKHEYVRNWDEDWKYNLAPAA